MPTANKAPRLRSQAPPERLARPQVRTTTARLKRYFGEVCESATFIETQFSQPKQPRIRNFYQLDDIAPHRCHAAIFAQKLLQYSTRKTWKMPAAQDVRRISSPRNMCRIRHPRLLQESLCCTRARHPALQQLFCLAFDLRTIYFLSIAALPPAATLSAEALADPTDTDRNGAYFRRRRWKSKRD